MSLRAELVRLGTRRFLKSGNGPDVTIAERRRREAGFERWVAKPRAGTKTLAVQIGGISASRVTTPSSRRDCQILFLHGGAYVTGSPTLYRHITWRLASAARAAVVAIDYRLAPEHPYPAALDDALAAWQGLLADGGDPRRMTILGASAGGGLALALALRLRDARLALPAAIVALSPWTDLALTGASCRLNAAADPMQNAADLPFLAAQYLSGTDPRDPCASPLYGDHTGLPPTLIQVGSDEILRDDAVRIAEGMRRAGCDVTLEIWKRMPHVWHAFAPILPEANRAIARIGTFLRQKTGAD